jgi:16S rRNA (uracil1498-N3)-methyltransferase
VPRPATGKLRDREVRWQGIAREAARQSGRVSIPRILSCRPLEEILSGASTGVRVLLHEKESSRQLDEVLRESPDAQRHVLIGPEGGFTDKECSLAEDKGFEIAGLGLPVLRAETAAIVAAAFACLDRRRPVE